MTSVIDTPPAPDLIELGAPPIDSIEATNAYEAEMDGYAPEWMHAEVARLFAGINVWWETPAQTAKDVYDVVRTIAAGQDHLWGQTAGNRQADVLADPNVGSYLYQRFVGRMQRNEDGRQKIMHNLMERQIIVLRDRLNETRTWLNRFSHQIVGSLENLIVTERAQRKAGDQAVVRLMMQVKADTIRELRQWSVDTVYLPLAREITHTHAVITQETTHAIAVNHEQTLNEVLRAIAPIAVAAFAANKIAQNLQTVNDTCVQPMCQTQGPNTGLGKLFNALKGVEWLAILAALEAMDVKTLEHLAARLAGLEGSIGEWAATHILSELEGEHH